MGRLHHLRQTLQKNIDDNADCADVEYVLLDYNSKDDLEGWVQENIANLPGVVYWRERLATRWRMPHAKNLSHLLASGDVLCNLDADNRTGKGYASMLARTFSEHPDSIVTHVHGGSFGGRVAIRASDFRRLRGYDERLSFGWGWEDDDLKARAATLGLQLSKVQMEGDGAIDHDDSERIKFMPEWKSMREAHGRQMEIFQNRKHGSQVNVGGYGRAVVYREFSPTGQLISDTIPVSRG